MKNCKRIYMIGDITYNPTKLFIEQLTKFAKGFIKLGHDIRMFSYSGALAQFSPFRSKNLSRLLCKRKVDKLLVAQISAYDPHIVFINFPKFLDNHSMKRLKQVAPSAIFIGFDGDAWPHLREDRIETAKSLDILMATNDGTYLQSYKNAGIPLCVFLPNFCDPDTEYRYNVKSRYKTDILWVGKLRHHADNSDNQREKLIKRLEGIKNCTLYGCCGRAKISGLNYLYAISGARICVSINAVNTVRLYHSDRLTHYLSCGGFVLSKRVPDSELLFQDRKHLRYFDENDEFFELADWYLQNHKERQRIADCAMSFTHKYLNNVQIAQYVLDLVEHGTYKAPWTATA